MNFERKGDMVRKTIFLLINILVKVKFMNVTKADIVERVAKNVGTNRTEAKAVVEEVLATVVDSLKEGNKIELWEPVDSIFTEMGGKTTK